MAIQPEILSRDFSFLFSEAPSMSLVQDDVEEEQLLYRASVAFASLSLSLSLCALCFCGPSASCFCDSEFVCLCVSRRPQDLSPGPEKERKRG